MADVLEGGLLELEITQEALEALSGVEKKVRKIKKSKNLDTAYLRIVYDRPSGDFKTAVDNEKDALDKQLVVGGLEIIADNITARALQEKAIKLHYLPDMLGQYRLALTSPYAGKACNGCSGGAGCCG
ncbi:hypothetical protein COT72_05315 [archaeon CG10_big_fil_rev_8_21_14_0_10_43_11]|nr:MAG: hypothetical protein COT72_05315 [archaeon CG10_big_fil_rev_8_21_14_0_10_43_11]